MTKATPSLHTTETITSDSLSTAILGASTTSPTGDAGDSFPLGAEVAIGLGGVGVVALCASMAFYFLRMLRKRNKQSSMTSNEYVLEEFEGRNTSRASGSSPLRPNLIPRPDNIRSAITIDIPAPSVKSYKPYRPYRPLSTGIHELE